MATSSPPLPGPVESKILADLAPAFAARRGETPRGALRVIEGGQGAPLVLIHGRGSAATTWFPILPALARSRRVLAVDLPGFGQSPAPRFSGGVEDAIDFFTGPVEAWMMAEGLLGASLMGHSLGGMVAVELALRGRVEPGKLVILGGMGLGAAMTYASRAFFRLGPERLARVVGEKAFGRLFPPPPTHDGARQAALSFELYAVRGGRPAASAAFDALCPAVGPAPNRAERLGEVRVPALIVWGDHDEVFPAPVAIAASARMPKAELRIEPLGHSPHLEAPDRVLPLIEGFLG